MKIKSVVREQDFQNAIMTELSRTKCFVLWRQNSGTIVTKNRGTIKLAPEGSADITGLVIGYGLRVEIEVKLVDKRTEAQLKFSELCKTWGIVYAYVVYDKTLDLVTNVSLAVENVLNVVEERTRNIRVNNID